MKNWIKAILIVLAAFSLSAVVALYEPAAFVFCWILVIAGFWLCVVAVKDMID